MLKFKLKKHIGLNDIALAVVLYCALFSAYLVRINDFTMVFVSLLEHICVFGTFLLLAINILKNSRFDYKTFRIIVIGSLIYCGLLLINFANTQNFGFELKNILTLSKMIVVELIVIMIAKSKSFDFFAAMRKLFYFFNIWGILNMVVITIQINVKGFMLPEAWLLMNSYYDDLCAGLFGYNGTHKLGMYMTFLFLYNIYMAEFHAGNIKKKMLYVYNFIILAWDFVLSTYNDNMTVYMLTVIGLTFYIILRMHWTGFSIFRSFNWIKYAALFFFGVIILLFIPAVQDFLFNTVFSRVTRLFSVTATSSFASAERLSIILSSFDQGFGYSFGEGLGFSPLREGDDTNPLIGFQHFGISSMSALIYLTGIWFFLFLVFWKTLIYRELSRSRDKVFHFITILFVLFISFYTTLFTSLNTTVFMIFIFVVYCMMEESIRERKLI